jgi:hypothetical protein
MASTNGVQVLRLAEEFKRVLDELLSASPEELEILLARASECRESILAAKEAWKKEERQ